MVSPVRGDHRRFQAETPLIDLFKFAEPALNPKPFVALNHFTVPVATFALPFETKATT